MARRTARRRDDGRADRLGVCSARLRQRSPRPRAATPSSIVIVDGTPPGTQLPRGSTMDAAASATVCDGQRRRVGFVPTELAASCATTPTTRQSRSGHPLRSDLRASTASPRPARTRPRRPQPRPRDRVHHDAGQRLDQQHLPILGIAASAARNQAASHPPKEHPDDHHHHVPAPVEITRRRLTGLLAAVTAAAAAVTWTVTTAAIDNNTAQPARAATSSWPYGAVDNPVGMPHHCRRRCDGRGQRRTDRRRRRLPRHRVRRLSKRRTTGSRRRRLPRHRHHRVPVSADRPCAHSLDTTGNQTNPRSPP